MLLQPFSQLRLLLFIFLPVVLWSCKMNDKEQYAIKDFSPSLQPHLKNMVSRGIVYNHSNTLRNMATDKDLIHLVQSEHAILRAEALTEMLDRKSFRQFDLIMSHLDDTALIQVYMGEFGIFQRTVSDNMLLDGDIVWDSQVQKDSVIEKVLLKHNFLSSAYYILRNIKPQEKYYAAIRTMATRPIDLSVYEIETRFDLIEHALFGLAEFKKPQDIPLIKKQMLNHRWQLSYVSFNLMENFPDTAYFEVLKAYYRRDFFRSTGHSRDGFSGTVIDRADPKDFIKALVIQKTDSSASLLDALLTRLPSENCMPNNKYITDQVIREVWEYPCIAYEGLRKKIRTRAEAMLKKEQSGIIPYDPNYDLAVDTTKRVIRGW
jgi:hypothetical protein